MLMTKLGNALLLLVGAVLLAASAFANEPDRPSVAAPTAIAEGPPKPFEVRVEGEGPAMILIPGLMCEGTVWNQTVEHFADRYQCHVLSLAGFAGVPPVEGPFLPTMRDAVVGYIRENRLESPIIVGHSLGGHLALAVAIAAPGEVGPIVAVDGVPALGVLMNPGASAEAIASQSEAMANAMAEMPRLMFVMQNRFMIGQLVQKPETADWLSQSAGKSDLKTVARAMHEVMTADLRDAAVDITSPVLLVGAAEYAKDDATQAVARERYEQQVAKIPNHKVVMVYDARHFVMLDKPEFFFDLLDDFLTETR